MRQTHAPRTPQSDNLGAILDGWLTTMCLLAREGNLPAALWLPLLSAEPTAGRRLARFGEMRMWLLGLPVAGAPTPPTLDDLSARRLYEHVFGSH